LRNEVVQGRVIQVLADQDAVIAIKQRHVIARSQVPLEKDQVLVLRVEETSPTPLLRVLGRAGRSPGAGFLMQAADQNPWRQMLDHLEKSVTFSKEQLQLRHVLKDLSTLPQTPGSPQFLREWVEKSGLCLEARLRSLCLRGRPSAEEVDRLTAGDLKGLLAKMMNGGEAVPPMAGNLHRVLEHLQWFNHGSLDQEGKMFLLLPCLASDGSWTVAQLLIAREGKGGSGERRSAEGCRVVWVSEFSNLGWVRAEATVQGKGVGIGFLSGRAESASLLQEHLPVLIGILEAQGFHVGQARCGTLAPEILKCSIVQELTGVGAPSFSTFV
jgi:hypothetical protein